jgi:CIC family chloride channel protein
MFLNRQRLVFLLLVLLVGAVAGLGAVFFRALIAFFHNLFFYGHFSTTLDFFQHAAPSHWGAGIVLVPVFGAACVAYLVQHFAPEAKGHGVPEVIDAVYYHRGVMRPIVAVIKAITSSISIGSGGSIGREGPIIQIGAAFGSTLGQWLKTDERTKIILIACGGSAGLAATFNTPIGGILFAIEVVLLQLDVLALIAVSLATAIGTAVSYLYFGNLPFIFPMPADLVVSHMTQLHSIVNYIVIGIVVGGVSAFFIHIVYWMEDIFDRLLKNNMLRHMLGMFLVGLSMYAMLCCYGKYYIEGVGYATVMDVLRSVLSHPGFLLLLAILKILDTALTLGSGGSGGIFSPSLFIGATTGAAVSGLCNDVLGFGAVSLPLGAMVGMAGVVGASTGAPITAVVMVVEMLNDLSASIPLITVVAIACWVRHFFVKDNIYTMKLTRRGHIIRIGTLKLST